MPSHPSYGSQNSPFRPSPSSTSASPAFGGSSPREALYYQRMQHSVDPSGSRRDRQNSTHSNSLASTSSSPSRSASISGTNATFVTPPQTEADQSTGRAKAVVRAACLACRTAKRRCDGGQPVCGPCQARGVSQESGGCAYVASKRGGPRFKGCTGEQARKIKAEKDKGKGQHPPRKSKGNTEDRSTSAASRDKQSPSDSNHSVDAERDNLRTTKRTDATRRDSELFHTPSSSTAAKQGVTSPAALSMQSGAHNRSSPSVTPYAHYGHPDYSRSGFPQSAGSSIKTGTIHADGDVPEESRSALSAANLAIWQRHQDSQTMDDLDIDIGNLNAYDADAGMMPQDLSFDDFYSRLESLPKAGQVGSGSTGYVDLTTWDTSNNDILDAADSEQQARFLLTYFFEKVYSSAPVLLGAENMSSLAFWFSGKGPCALYAAIAALVTLRLPEHEAYRTLRGGYASLNNPNVGMTRNEVAAQHARTSEFLLKRFSEQQAVAAAATFGLDPSTVLGDCNDDVSGRSLCQGPSDPELLRIEAAAAHTLLAHYHYGAGGHTAQSVAHSHALEAWTSLQGVRFDLKEGMAPKDPLSTSHFSWDQKQEWAKRVYWTSFAATSVTACTGGFAPVKGVCDPVTALKLRPALEADVGAWGVYIRGAQHVARGYAALHAFETLKRGKDVPEEDIARDKALIFSEYSKLDRDMTAFTTYDPAWRSPSEGSGASRSGDEGLGFALRTAGKLMTAGATIIVHRGQAYANANIFLEPQCGLPQASRNSAEQQDRSAKEALFGKRIAGQMPNGMDLDNRSRSPSPSEQYVTPDRLWHRSGSVTLPPAGSGSRGSGSEGCTTCKPSNFDPQVAALDANFIHYPLNTGSNGNWIAGAGQAAQHHHHHHQQQQQGNHGRIHGSNGATDAAMAAFHHFQTQEQAGHRGESALSHVGNGSGYIHRFAPLAPPTSAFLSERYLYGPFEPEHSIDKCRWAASAMLSSVGPLLHGRNKAGEVSQNILGNSSSEAPSLPPWAACSYVLAGYCLLMQCLIVQASRAWRHSSQTSTAEALSNGGAGDELDTELKELRGQVLAIHDLLEQFALTFDIAREYKKEVAVLLEVNTRLK
ncbi:hypothetical protein BCV69DRAFT_296706 [Microstroma glucosiphilum]|uniref:Zn(2)-C6 fungal-type domain-containing protein n=1 Tax=Pseudomicrostroma glucosiphilum TaxID=1684307 RepID=A0A316UC07_9BASI|nr:hypothetical protein BCV69DRAFT_296706 [Pseudomicrostroma glucosiphilum]PWN22726.1 hypothetical protein BCV69DRAFT_296706 [Pseudomicrostroma glucosiphilum]